MRREASKRYHFLLLSAFLVIGLVVPMTALGAGDDCPPPSDGGFGDTYPQQPVDDEPDEKPAAPANEPATEEDGGVLGSLGSMSSDQLTIGILAVVGVIVGAVYFFMVTRMDDDILE